MADHRSWVEVVGYGHEVLHTGVLANLLEGSDGPAVAAVLTGRTQGQIASVSEVRREARLDGARGKADLTARVRLSDGDLIPVAVETKVHSDGSLDQLERTTENSPRAEGVLLALGLTAFKLREIHTAEVSDAHGHEWHWVGPRAWLDILEQVSDQGRTWLPPYRSAVANWERGLDCGGQRQLGHLRWMNSVLDRLAEPERWREIRTSQSGPLMSRFSWKSTHDNDIYLEFMGHGNGRRDLRLKIGGGDPAELDRLAGELAEPVERLGWTPGRRGRTGSSRTVATSDDLVSIEAATTAASAAVDLLDTTFP